MLRELQETNAALQDVRELLRQQVCARTGVGGGEEGWRRGLRWGGGGLGDRDPGRRVYKRKREGGPRERVGVRDGEACPREGEVLGR